MKQPKDPLKASGYGGLNEWSAGDPRGYGALGKWASELEKIQTLEVDQHWQKIMQQAIAPRPMPPVIRKLPEGLTDEKFDGMTNAELVMEMLARGWTVSKTKDPSDG